MSWMLNLYKTYEACEDAVGICGERQDGMLLPLGHLLTEVDIIVHLGSDGTFLRAEKTDSSSRNLICVPCTDDSESRSSKKAINFPHPLFDQIKYIATQKYRDNLKGWLNYLNRAKRYPIAAKAISAVYQYILKDSLPNDLKLHRISVKDQLFIAFCVNLSQSYENRLWCMPELWKAWIDYCLDEVISGRSSKDVCYITSQENISYTEKHPKSINRFSGNAKLITGNDGSNFTFRGRFEYPSQAVTVSYEASQKAHQALRWLISKPSCYRIGSQAIIAWAIDSVPDIAPFYKDSYDIYNIVASTDEEKLVSADSTVYVDYAVAFKKALSGYNAPNILRKHKRRIAVMSTDSATTGRLSVTYYRELTEDEYVERIMQWHDTCKWYQPFGKTPDGHIKPGYFIGAPAFDRITLAIFGKRRKKKDESYDKIEKSFREQLLHFIFDGERIPLSILQATVGRVSNPFSFENSNAKNNIERWLDWEIALGAACALIRKYYHDDKKEVYNVELETNRDDRDYLYGRLLAIADDIESRARFKQGKTKDEVSATNAIRYMTAFAQNPFRTWNLLFTQQLNPYIQQLSGADWHMSLIREIMCKFKPREYESNVPLDGLYLLGFFAQKQKIFEERSKKKANKDVDKEENP